MESMNSGELVSVLFILIILFGLLGVVCPAFEFFFSKFPKLEDKFFSLFGLTADDLEDEHNVEIQETQIEDISDKTDRFLMR